MDIAAWLQDLELQRYVSAFHDNDIDGEILSKLTAEDLIGIGVTSVPCVAVTFFSDKVATVKAEATLPLSALAARIQRATAQDKACLPWLKLATFGEKRSDKGSLRHDENVIAVSGIEADYDAGQIPFADAVEKLLKAGGLGIRAIAYTSPSHTPLD